jgi:hypothetical protein
MRELQEQAEELRTAIAEWARQFEGDVPPDSSTRERRR